MTNLTNLSPAASYGDLITCTNNGQGLTATLQPIQDGLGNSSAIQLSTVALNVVGTFQVNGATYAPVNYLTGNILAATVDAMFVTPVSILPAPGTGLMYVIQSFAVEIISTGHTAFAGGGNVYLQYGVTGAGTNYATVHTGIPAAFVNGAVNAAISTTGQINATTGLVTTVAGNAPITMTNDTGAFTAGAGSSLNLYLTYITVAIV